MEIAWLKLKTEEGFTYVRRSSVTAIDFFTLSDQIQLMVYVEGEGSRLFRFGLDEKEKAQQIVSWITGEAENQKESWFPGQ